MSMRNTLGKKLQCEIVYRWYHHIIITTGGLVPDLSLWERDFAKELLT